MCDVHEISAIKHFPEVTVARVRCSKARKPIVCDDYRGNQVQLT